MSRQLGQYSVIRRTSKTTPDWMAEGARFELADGLPHLRFSRPARSATPSPLRAPHRLNCQHLLKQSSSPPHREVAPGLRIRGIFLLISRSALVGHRAGGRDADGPRGTGASIYRA